MNHVARCRWCDAHLSAQESRGNVCDVCLRANALPCECGPAADDADGYCRACWDDRSARALAALYPEQRA